MMGTNTLASPKFSQNQQICFIGGIGQIINCRSQSGVRLYPYGVKLNARLVLDRKLTRQEIKPNTLNKYVHQHQTGWKKRLELAQLLSSIGRWEEAIAVCQGSNRQGAIAFESAAALEPNNLARWHALGQVYLSLEDPIGALKAFDAILTSDPDNVVALNYSYDLLLAAGNFPEAQRRLDKALTLAPQEFPTLKRLAHRRISLGLVWDEEGKQTERTIQTLLQLAPHAADAEELLASYYIRRGETAKGIDRLQKFVEERPKDPHGWYYYARCLDRTGDPQRAADAILKAYKLYPSDAEIYRATCEILPAAGRLNELQPLVEEMLQRFPERWSMWTTAGRVLVKYFQDVERGCNISAQAMQLQPNLADAWFQHGRVLALAGKHQEAVEALERGWQLLPEDGECWRSLPVAVWLSESYRALGNESASKYWCRYWW